MLGAGKRVVLSLGKIGEIAHTKLNGVDLGVQWAPPFEVDLTKAAKPGKNRLEIRVTNFWANRVIGDAGLPESERKTRTNITFFKADSPLMPSGLLGPVELKPYRATQ
jgi:hypothetical protein